MSEQTVTRRPLSSRDTTWAKAIARSLAARRIPPNTISVLSVLFAAIGATLLLAGKTAAPHTRAILLLLTMVAIQGRLLCNLFDGMVAIEGGMKTPAGEVYNELPDRFADAILLISAGYSVVDCPLAVPLGWTAAMFALITAYVRALGASMGAGQQFCGPMAKQHRMALLTAACALSALETVLRRPQVVLSVALAIMILGMILTIARRLARIKAHMEAK
jgi:phosphatidylglycerophosphate synthase